MGTFDSHVDAPLQLKQEGENLDISFERTGSTTGTVTWLIPSPVAGCTSTNQSYNGIVVVLNTVANAVNNRPVDGTVYTGDPTADSDLHAGDSINGSLVIGAFYDDKTTVEIDLTGLIPNTAYFITGHILDNVYRYHWQGVSTYALPYLYTEPQADSCAYQEITLGTTSLTDATGLTPATSYTLDLSVDQVDYDLIISGTDALTYSTLVDAINNALKIAESPFQGPVAANTGAYWYDSTNGKLYQWDGDSHVEIAVIKELTSPTNVVAGEYWLNTLSGVLSKWTSGWVTQTTTDVGWNPAVPTDDAYWDQTTGASQMWAWDGSVWCTRPTFIQTTDPSCAPDLTSSSYWYDETSEMLFVWNVDTSAWEQTEGIAWDSDPTTPAIGTFWFDDTNNDLYERTNSSTWTEQSVTISETAPQFPSVGDYWFVSSTQELFTRSSGSPEWAPTAVLVWGSDPTIPGQCELWWDTSGSPQADILSVRDSLNDIWTPVQSFTVGTTDPSLPQTLEIGTIWRTGALSPITTVYWEWDGSQFVQLLRTNVVQFLTDPTLVSIGDVWYDNVNDIYYERIASSGSPELSAWEVIDVISSEQNPTSLTVGTFWYDTTNDSLKMWNGAAWVTTVFSTTSLIPANETLWYNTTTDELVEWSTSSVAWVESTPIAVTTFNDAKGACPAGNIIISTTNCGSSGQILIGTSTQGDDITTFVAVSYTFTGTLFPALGLTTLNLKPNIIGGDGLTGIPSYDTIGVGTDGTADERRELADSIRKQLGWPTVEVELTKYEMDQAITKALEALRQKSASAYRRVYFFIDAKIGQQNYLMTNERVGFNKIVNIMGAWRITSAFLSTVHAAGVYGQTIMQHLYQMGTYDLVSYHLISDYIEQLEQLFATRIVYTFDEGSRTFSMFQRFTRDERILLDCVIERTEQELLVNRLTKPWIERWALAEARVMLSEVRGKYANLPGAGGGVSLNAADLANRADQDFEKCLQDIDDFVVNDVENLGIGSEFIIG